MAPQYLSTAEYAKHRGIAERSVRKAIEHGRLASAVRREGRLYVIDMEMADQEWKATTDVARGGKRQAGNHGADYAEARRRRVILETALLGLELRERQAQLVEAAAVETSRHCEADRVVTAFMALPALLAPLIAAESDGFRVHSILTQAFRETLIRLSQEG